MAGLKSFRRIRSAAAWLWLPLLIGAAVIAVRAEEWPARQAWWLVPYPAGGGADLVARVVGAEVAKRLGHQILIDNKPGASTVIGMRQVASATPDGYTVGTMTADIAVTTAFGQANQIDVERDFAYVTQLIDVPMVLVANGKVPFRSLQQFVEYAKANPGKVTAASIGATSIHHVGMEWFKKLAGIDMLVVPYRGVAPGLQAVIAGEVQMMFMGVGVGDDFIAKGDLVQLAVGSEKRSSRAPDVPTFAESGYPTFDLVSWYGVVAPAKTAAERIEWWQREIKRAHGAPEIRTRIESTGAEINAGRATEFGQMVVDEVNKYRHVIQLTGAKP